MKNTLKNILLDLPLTNNSKGVIASLNDERIIDAIDYALHLLKNKKKKKLVKYFFTESDNKDINLEKIIKKQIVQDYDSIEEAKKIFKVNENDKNNCEHYIDNTTGCCVLCGKQIEPLKKNIKETYVPPEVFKENISIQTENEDLNEIKDLISDTEKAEQIENEDFYNPNDFRLDENENVNGTNLKDISDF